ncbi:hypothetical protein N7457_005770 [Penicillium paradoxum]|uniref:uncharacterized protein n=1 Tax=Penicillium paradoxum TaxID=176176 RepID=UPI002547945A|nr:uncharacterized protein N7457_005770 [Penicillium paradoxum]KAJ5780610.1 hypothetical protein N7457_005770 [Penicillium paradoxum]
MEVAQDTASQGNISENRHAAIFGVGIGFIVFDSIIIALRIYARAFMLKALGADDIRAFQSYGEQHLITGIRSDTHYRIVNKYHGWIQLRTRKARACDTAK